MLLAREMLTVEPYKCKNRSRESGQAWDLIAANLNSVHVPHFRVSQKSVRDRARILLKNFKLKVREEEKASGIEVPELSELDAALEEIAEKEKAAQSELDLEESVKRDELLYLYLVHFVFLAQKLLPIFASYQLSRFQVTGDD